jgi:chemotaxis protein MotB
MGLAEWSVSAARFVALLAPALLAGCGYTEYEWKAQLSRYERLQGEVQGRDDRIHRLEEEIARERTGVGELADRLRAAGIDPERLETARDALARQGDEDKTRRAIEAQNRSVLRALDPIVAGEGGVRLSTRNGHVVISLPGQLVFKAGSDALSKGGEQTLRQLAALIRGDEMLKGLKYQVTGHTTAGSPTAVWRNGLELTMAQARSVLLFLVADKGGALPVASVGVASVSDADPAGARGAVEPQKKSPRCEIVVLTGEGEPAAHVPL